MQKRGRGQKNRDQGLETGNAKRLKASCGWIVAGGWQGVYFLDILPPTPTPFRGQEICFQSLVPSITSAMSLIPKDLFRKVVQDQGLRPVFCGFALFLVRKTERNFSFESVRTSPVTERNLSQKKGWAGQKKRGDSRAAVIPFDHPSDEDLSPPRFATPKPAPLGTAHPSISTQLEPSLAKRQK